MYVDVSIVCTYNNIVDGTELHENREDEKTCDNEQDFINEGYDSYKGGPSSTRSSSIVLGKIDAIRLPLSS